MSKHLAKGCLYQLPSGTMVHPCRLIFRDGTLMWKHALLCSNEFTSLPQTQAHEQHIVKTAQRLEELNTWVSQELEPWECLIPFCWYDPLQEELSEGISLYFYHNVHKAEYVYTTLVNHIQPHEKLKLIDNRFPQRDLLYFQRC